LIHRRPKKTGLGAEPDYAATHPKEIFEVPEFVSNHTLIMAHINPEQERKQTHEPEDTPGGGPTKEVTL
jgi:hypothetical protein